MAELPNSVYLFEAGPSLEPELVLDPLAAAAYDGPKQAYRAVSNPDIDWEALARHKTHPLRILILEVLIERDEPMSPTGLVPFTGTSLGTTAYHVNQLAEAGLLEETHHRQRRGAREHFYRVKP